MQTINFISIWNYSFAQKEFLWGLFVIPVLLLLHFLIFKKKRPGFKINSTINAGNAISVYQLIQDILFIVSMIGLAFLILAMARPQDESKAKELKENFTQGIDIMLAMDISASMNAEDFHKDRLDASIRMAKKFVDMRENDNLGLVVYGGEAFMMSPLSNDHFNLKEKLDELNTGMVTPSTAIGDGLNLAAASIYKSKAKSKIIILMTDGVNNAGEIAPLQAAENAETYDIRVYTIGIGSNGTAMIPIDMGGVVVRRPMPVEIDEELLQTVSEMTGGQYYRATSEEKLEAIYKEIDELEKTKLKTFGVKIDPPEEFRSFLWPGLVLLLIPLLLNLILFRKIP